MGAASGGDFRALRSPHRADGIGVETAERHHAQTTRFVAGHPGIPVTEVPAAAQDIHDLDGLREIASALAVAAMPIAGAENRAG